MPWNVKGRVGVIAGASCAVGRELSRRLAVDHQMQLACISRKDMCDLPANCTAFKADVRSSNGCDALMKEVQSNLGPISLLINCAGITLSKMHVRCTDADYDDVMDTNVRGALHLTRAALRHGGLLKTQDGCVLHIGSVAGLIGNDGQVLYSASKAALAGATKSWSREYGPRNIRFNVVAPGLIDGEGMKSTLNDSQVQRWREACPLKRLASVNEVVDVVMAVSLCTFINGQVIAVDGGLS